MTEREICEVALKTFGKDAQTFKAFEEMAELQKELCKERLGESDLHKIAEEIADVLIMLQQMAILHDCESLVDGYREFKLARLEKKLGGQNENHQGRI